LIRAANLSLLALLLATPVLAALIPPGASGGKPPVSKSKAAMEARQRSAAKLIDQLEKIRETISKLEKSLYDELRETRSAQLNFRKLSLLDRLQKKERELGQLRLLELENTVNELESRRKELRSRTVSQQAAIRSFLAGIERSVSRAPDPAMHASTTASASEKLEAPKRKVLANLVERGIREIETYKADLTDADQLEHEIREEKRQLANLFQDLDEQETVLQMNKQLQADLMREHDGERAEQIENYRKLRFAENQVEDMLKQFNSRAELERTVEADRDVYRGLREGAFAMMRGRLPLPVRDGRVISGFGRTFDTQSQLYVFRKGISIDGGSGSPVNAVSAGRVAYAGELPDYGKVAIIDHGEHYYTLCAHLGELRRNTGDAVMAGDPIGMTDESGTPVYFEIRDRNIAVNPLQWVAN
jgi:septal ring factor EnvC (AmiA/AmiB activator)